MRDPDSKRRISSPVWRFVFALHLYAAIGALGILILSGSAGIILWKVPAARRWAHSRVASLYLADVAPKVPFKITDVEVDSRWSDFLHGKLANIHMALDWSGWKLILTGPIDLFYDHREAETHLNVVFNASAQATPPGARPLPPIPVRIAFRAGDHFSHLDKLSIDSSLRDLRLSRFGLGASGVVLHATWDNGQALVHFAAKELSLAKENELRLSDLTVSASGGLKLKPFIPGPDLIADASVSRAQVSLSSEEEDLDVPLANFPIQAKVSFPRGNERVISFNTKAGEDAGSTIDLSGTFQPDHLDLDWKTPRLTVRELIAAARSVRSDLPLLASLKWIRKLSGTVATQGSAHLPLPFSIPQLTKPGGAEINADLSVKNLGFEWPGRYLALAGANLELPISTRTGLNGSVSIQKLLYRRFKGRLEKTRLQILPVHEDSGKFSVHLGNGPSIPIKMDGLAIHAGAVDGTITAANYDLTSSFVVPPTDMSTFAHSLCIKTEHLPPARLSINLPEIDLSPGTLDLSGDLNDKIEISLFDGKADVTDLAFYNLGTPVPETDFDLDLSGVRLDEVGAWSGFGEMDGTLHAYAHDVVMQAWLPTQYDFSFQAVPYSRSEVVFSPEAMKNVARLIASNAIDRLPGIARWLAFGWPRRVIGGYDVYFFGVSLISRDGNILFSALDPPDLPPMVTPEQQKRLLEKQKQNHYILYGDSFKIPINSSRYPLLVNATQVSNYVHSVIEKFAAMAEVKKQNELAALAKKLKSAQKAKEIIWHEEHEVDCASPTL